MDLIIYRALMLRLIIERSTYSIVKPPILHPFSHFTGVEFIISSNKKEGQLKQEWHI